MKLGAALKRPAGEAFTSDELESEAEGEVVVDIDAVKNSFIASGRDLFDFVMQYEFPKTLDFGEKVTIYCQLISLYPMEIELTNEYATSEDIEYVMAYPKKA
jgi:hypothetical protein